MKILVTGAAGFIGSYLVKAIFGKRPDAVVVGVDNMNDYYDVRLKEERLAELEGEFLKVYEKLEIAEKMQKITELEKEVASHV